MLAVAAVAVVVLTGIGRHPIVSTSGLGSKHAASSVQPSATPLTAAIAEAGNQYLAAVAPVNADGDRFVAALAADETMPCSCSPGEFAIRADAVAVIPQLSTDTESLQVVLQTIRHEVPSIAADIDAVVLDNQRYTDYLAAAYRASQQSGAAGLGADVTTAQAIYQASRPDFARLRSDLGLPPPPTG
jgi:hypothetical protein